MELFRAYERRAREAGKGLWAPEVGSAAMPSDARDTAAATVKPVVTPPGQEAQDQTVYITRTGTKYHRAGCRSLARSSIPISLKGAKARGYTPCAICRPPE